MVLNGYVGEVRLFASARLPEGWLRCDGQLVSIDEYESLHALIGDTYGPAEPRAFRLPDLRGRVVVGRDRAEDTVTGRDRYPLGSTGGAEKVALAGEHLPAHTHRLRASSRDATVGSPAGGVPAVANNLALYSADPTPIKLAAMLGSAGHGQAHDNVMPILGVTFGICGVGEFPSGS